MTSNLIINDIQTKKIIDQYKNYYSIVHINKGFYIFIVVILSISIIILTFVIIFFKIIISKIRKLDQLSNLYQSDDQSDVNIINFLFIVSSILQKDLFSLTKEKLIPEINTIIGYLCNKAILMIIEYILLIILLFTKNNRDIYLDKNLTNNNVKYKVYILNNYIYILIILFILKINFNILSILNSIMLLLTIIFIYQSQDQKLKHKYETKSKDSQNILKIEIVNNKQFILKKKINGNEVAEIINIE